MTPEDFIKREQEIMEATKEFPGEEMWAAYERWKKMRGEVPMKLSTGDPSLKAVHATIRKSAERPCTQSECDGVQFLESVCGGCVEGRAGYKSKWTCNKCLHRELSKKEYMECLKELTKTK